LTVVFDPKGEGKVEAALTYAAHVIPLRGEGVGEKTPPPTTPSSTGDTTAINITIIGTTPDPRSGSGPRRLWLLRAAELRAARNTHQRCCTRLEGWRLDVAACKHHSKARRFTGT
jgi:hypothetical protein